MGTEFDMKKFGHTPSAPCDAGSLTSGWSSSTTNASSIPSSLISEMDNLNIDRIERYAAEAGDARFMSDKTLESHTKSLREKAISSMLKRIESAMNVDLCYVLDCTGSMYRHIAAAKDCIMQVVSYMERTNPSIKIRVGFCGYRDHCDGDDNFQIFDFTNSYEQFRNNISNEVSAKGGGDGPEDVLGGINAAITQMSWLHTTRVIFHIGDYPPHGRRYTKMNDDYPEGDPNGLTAESVLEKMQSSNILYFFGKITNHTDEMLRIFRDIIGEIQVFDFDSVELIFKYFQATCLTITSSVSLTATLGNDVYSLRRKELEINPDEPDWDTIDEQTGTVLRYHLPKTLDDIMNKEYFKKSNANVQSLSFKLAPQPFSVGAERYAYFALDVKREPAEKVVIKEYLEIGRKANSVERYLEAVEVSTIAHFLSKQFNIEAKRVGINKKVKFLQAKLLRGASGSKNQFYTIEPNLRNAKYKRFNVNSGIITEFHSTLEAFAHFTYDYTGGYLLVYDLQGAEFSDQFLLTDPALQCTDSLRFGRTNLGRRGIEECFLANHKCSSVCKKLGLDVTKSPITT
ncbi:15953_t:CDS:1 [Funneliformis geosporum]|uniref:8162_t:CDS:1 n=1 Tax=Funneliformis geosporum TaxID=1117311 RepID=A0A9W4SJG5_9GLOM|nr:15953_t:CDS:1 [Funneliformis geosporum]CAI2170815.1 8162_t:CDS:1 [Funneliformis geosporum]